MSLVNQHLRNNISNIEETDDHIYIDIDINYDPSNITTEASTPSNYKSTKTESIIRNPSEYHLTVDRFVIPGYLLPSMIFNPIHPGTVVLEWSGAPGVHSTVDLVYTPHNTLQPWQEGYYYLYDFQHWADMVNTALATAHAGLAGAPGPSLPPYIVWDTDAQKFIFYGQKAYYDMSGAHIKVFFNTPIYKLLPFMPYADDYANLPAPGVHGYYQLLFKDYKNNTESISAVDYLAIKQQANGASYWQPVKGLIFISNTIPVKNTYTSLNSNNPQNSNSNSLGILIDFKIDASSALDQRKTLIYVPGQNIRKLDLYGQTPLKTLDIGVYWTDLDGELHPLRIPSFESVNIKLLFIKKKIS